MLLAPKVITEIRRIAPPESARSGEQLGVSLSRCFGQFQSAPIGNCRRVFHLVSTRARAVDGSTDKDDERAPDPGRGCRLSGGRQRLCLPLAEEINMMWLQNAATE